MPMNNPQAYLGLLLLVAPAIVYYFVVNKNIKRTSLYLVAYFGSIFIVKLITSLFAINLPVILGTISLLSIINVLVAVLIALTLIGDQLNLKNVAWLSGIVIVGQLVFVEAFKTITFSMV